MAKIFQGLITDEGIDKARDVQTTDGWSITPFEYGISETAGEFVSTRTISSMNSTWVTGKFSAVTKKDKNKLMLTISLSGDESTVQRNIKEIYIRCKTPTEEEFLYVLIQPLADMIFIPTVGQEMNFLITLTNTSKEDIYTIQYVDDTKLKAYQLVMEKGQSNGYCPLGADGFVPEKHLQLDSYATKEDLNSYVTIGTAQTISGSKTFSKPIVSTGNYVVTQGNITIKNLANNASTDAIIVINGDTNQRCGSLRLQNGDKYNEITLTAAAENGDILSMGMRNTNGVCYAFCPTYTTNYADSSTKIVTTQYMANHWTTSKATTSSSASKARPAVVIQNYRSGTSWYRVWSDGWIEQGGRAYIKFTGTNHTTVDQTSISFFKVFTTTDYTLTFTVEGSTSTNPNRTDDSTVILHAWYTPNVIVFGQDGGNNYYSTYVRWSACGY